MDYLPRRVYPSDVEAQTNREQHQQQKYAILNNTNSTGLEPPPQRRNIPRYHPANQKSSKNSCRSCVCCCFCFWIVLISLLAGSGVLLYTFLQPKMPIYNVDNFGVNAFNLTPDYSLYTAFVVTVKANNPNDHIGFTYGKDSSVAVSYSGSPLCTGQLPAYHQPKNNITMVQVELTGKNSFGSGLQEALMENKNTGKIPLTVEVKAPVSVVILNFPLRQVVVYVNCSLVVDNLSPQKQARILSSTYSYKIGL